ncbi:unnamed protein product [Peniophora sp. CBMAI 1063]|nr:unnamed protein product [Peniophora sp. CBMAI 1063]
MRASPDINPSSNLAQDLDACETCEKRQAVPAMFDCRIVQARNLPSRLGHSVRHAKYIAEVSIGGVTRTTRWPVKDENPAWNETLFGSIPVDFGGIPVTVRVIGIRHWHDPEVIATKALTVDLRREVPLGDGPPFVWKMERVRGSSEDLHLPDITVEIAFARVDSRRARKPTGAYEAPRCGSPGPHLPEWSRLIRATVNVVRAVDGIADIHPYATLALRLLSQIPRAAEDEIERDEVMQELRATVSDTFAFVEKSEPSKLWHDTRESDDHRLDILARLVRQLTECCRFMRAYADALYAPDRKSVSNLRAHVQRFRGAVKRLMAAFCDRDTCETDIAIHHLLSEDESDVSSECPTTSAGTASTASYSLLHPRSPNSKRSLRADVVDDVQKWIEDPACEDDMRALLVIGEEYGASSIAREIAKQYSHMGRLASSFTFDVSDGRGMHRPPQMCITTLARDLANFDVHCAAAMRASVTGNLDLAFSSDCSQLFGQLVQEPANKLSVVGPVVVVIDGLDLKGTVAERTELPRVLAAQLDRMPSNFRFVLTMKPDNLVERELARHVDMLRF